MILRTIHCDICVASEKESAENAGWKRWGAVQGIQFDNVTNPNLCPGCLTKVANYIDDLKYKVN